MDSILSKISIFLCSLLITNNAFTQIDKKIKTGIYSVSEKGIKFKHKESGKSYYINEQPICTIEHFKKVKIDFNSYGQYALYFELDTIGTKIFFQATQKWLDKRLAFIIDNELIYCPKVIAPIKGGKIIVTGSFKREEIKKMKIKIEKEMQSIRR